MAAAAAEVDKLAAFTKDPTHSVPDVMMQPIAMGRVASPEEVGGPPSCARGGGVGYTVSLGFGVVLVDMWHVPCAP